MCIPDATHLLFMQGWKFCIFLQLGSNCAPRDFGNPIVQVEFGSILSVSFVAMLMRFSIQDIRWPLRPHAVHIMWSKEEFSLLIAIISYSVRKSTDSLLLWWLKILCLTESLADEKHGHSFRWSNWSWSSFWSLSEGCNWWNTSDTRIPFITHLLASGLIGRVWTTWAGSLLHSHCKPICSFISRIWWPLIVVVPIPYDVECFLASCLRFFWTIWWNICFELSGQMRVAFIKRWLV